MQPPQQLVQWLRQSYPKPSIDEGWLSQCYAWVIEEHNLNPATDMAEIREQVESQLLMSDLTDSMIMALTEIGHSAFSLMNVRQTKIDRADLSGLARGDNEDGAQADEGPVPNYPRSMLQFELSDGAIKLNAIEYRKISQFDLENTPLGFKIQLQNVSIRHGIAFLEPRNVVLKGYSVEDLDVNRDRNFLRGLRLRLDPNDRIESDAESEGEGEGREVHASQLLPLPLPLPMPMPHAPARPNIPPVAGPSNGDIQPPPPPPTVTKQLGQPRPLARRTPRPGPSAPSTSRTALPTPPHFSTPGATMVAPMGLPSSRAPTEPLADEPPEPGSDWYFGHDSIDATFLSRAASELERSEAILSQPSQQSFSSRSQPLREIIYVDDEADKVLTGPGVVRRTLQQQSEYGGSVIDVTAEIVQGARIRRPIDNDDVISIGSDE
ncbi:hypothetical protein BC826DRAFT_1108025 [Russula brevipes]|nr:hypothetical protein BC826DRAFT_1108025 [Russula brevipes]